MRNGEKKEKKEKNQKGGKCQRQTATNEVKRKTEKAKKRKRKRGKKEGKKDKPQKGKENDQTGQRMKKNWKTKRSSYRMKIHLGAELVSAPHLEQISVLSPKSTHTPLWDYPRQSSWANSRIPPFLCLSPRLLCTTARVVRFL